MTTAMQPESDAPGYDPAADPVHGSGWNSAERWGGWSWRAPRAGEWFRTCSLCGCIHPEDVAPVLVAQGACTVCGRSGWTACFEAQQPGWYRAAKNRGELADFPADEIARAEALNEAHSYDPGGAYASLADIKYGWPHKAYIHNLKSRDPDRLYVIGARHHRPEDTEQDSERARWVPVAQIPEGVVTDGWRDLDGQYDEVQIGTKPTLFAKFYTLHLKDPAISDEAKHAVQRSCGVRITFTDDGRVSWARYAEPAGTGHDA
jgi:hypothetical protein